LSSLKERAGVKRSLACGFAVVPASAGMAELPHGWFPLMAAQGEGPQVRAGYGVMVAPSAG